MKVTVLRKTHLQRLILIKFFVWSDKQQNSARTVGKVLSPAVDTVQTVAKSYKNMPSYIYWLCFFFIINLIAMLVTIQDEHRAQKHRWRIPEHSLLILAAVGGSPAMFLTMLLIHHKTRHLKFMIGIPLIIIVQVCSILFILNITC